MLKEKVDEFTKLTLVSSRDSKKENQRSLSRHLLLLIKMDII